MAVPVIYNKTSNFQHDIWEKSDRRGACRFSAPLFKFRQSDSSPKSFVPHIPIGFWFWFWFWFLLPAPWLRLLSSRLVCHVKAVLELLRESSLKWKVSSHSTLI